MIRAEHNWDDDELELFRAGRDEAPSAGSANGVLAALGLDGPVGPDGGGDTSPVSSVEPAGRTPVPPPVETQPAVSGIFARPLTWIGAGGVVLALIPAALFLGSGDSGTSEAISPPEEVSTRAASGTLAERANVDAPEGVADEPAAIELSDLEEVEPESSAVNEAPTQKAESRRPSLAEELAIIKKARASLNAGDLAGCEAALTIHKQKFSPPRLASEALVVRVELLLRRGQREQAKRLAAPLMRANSPYRARMETLLSHP